AASHLVDGPQVRAVERDLGEVFRRDLGLRQDVLHGLAEQRSVRLGEREALLPRVREALAGRAPGVEKLAGERSGRLDLGNYAVRSEHEGHGAVAVLLLRLAFGGPEAAIRRHGDRLLRAAAHAVG